MRATDWNKIAPEYFKHIQSPFTKSVKNPIYRLLRRLGNTNEKSVLEVGCGTGTLIPFLAKNFKRVVAVDISRKMIEIAEEKHGHLENVELKVMDAVNITRLQEKFDVVVCVNSIIMPDIVKVNKVIKKMYRVLKKKGFLVGIFPSIDSLVYQAMITFDKEYERRKNRRKARRATRRIISARHHDFCFGFFDVGGRQKHYYGFELEYRMKKAGFRKIKVGKVKYPWELMDKEENPKQFIGGIYEELWDWTVCAQK